LVQFAPFALDATNAEEVNQFWAAGNPEDCKFVRLSVKIFESSRFKTSNTYHSILVEPKSDRPESLRIEIKDLKEFQNLKKH
jgi:hypothetical protein